MSIKRIGIFSSVVFLSSVFFACKNADMNNNPFLMAALLNSQECNRTIQVVNCGTPISLEVIDRDYYEKAQTELKIIYSGTSHSSQINSGLEELAVREAWCAFTFEEGTYGLLGDLGNPDYITWESETRTYLNLHPDVNVCMWSWCGQVGDADVDAPGRYLDLMEGLIRDYPDVTFVFMTGHCDEQGINGSANIANEKIRAHCLEHNRWLFDFADFDATNPAGVNFLAQNVGDHGNYDGGSWTQEWWEDHPEDYHSCGCTHSENATFHESLNCNRKAIGFVHLMARIAGWNGY